MDDLLERFFEEFQTRLWHKSARYVVKVSKLNGSFFVLVKKPRGQILNDDKTFLYNTVQQLSEDIYKKYAKNCNEFSHNFSPYFKLVNVTVTITITFYLIKKITVMAGEFRLLVKPRNCDCLYFCPHFYMSYRGKIMLRKYRSLLVRRGLFYIAIVV